MKAILVRIGIDQTYGHWNAPVDPVTNDWVYVPIPESPGTRMRHGLGRRFAEFRPAIDTFGAQHGVDLRWPTELDKGWVHLDPDFETLTYGDQGAKRGKGIRQLGHGDLLVFYASLRPITPCAHRLLYAIVGLYVIDEVVMAHDVEPSRWGENAHTRKTNPGADDIVVRAQPGISGRLERCIPIGEYRNGAYRVREELLDVWAGLSCRDGYLQRSGVPPRLLDAGRFWEWFGQQEPWLQWGNG